MTQIWAVDLDDTITSTPEAMKSLMEGVRAQGCEVHVVSGVKDGPVTAQALAQKKALLDSLGFEQGTAYDQLIAVGGPEKKVAAGKVAYMTHVGASCLVDDRKKNCKAAKKAGFLALRHIAPK